MGTPKGTPKLERPRSKTIQVKESNSAQPGPILLQVSQWWTQGQTNSCVKSQACTQRSISVRVNSHSYHINNRELRFVIIDFVEQPLGLF